MIEEGLKKSKNWINKHKQANKRTTLEITGSHYIHISYVEKCKANYRLRGRQSKTTKKWQKPHKITRKLIDNTWAACATWLI